MTTDGRLIRFGAGGGGMSAPAALRFVSAVELDEAMLGGQATCRGVNGVGGLVANQTRPEIGSCVHGGGRNSGVRVRCACERWESIGMA